MGPMKKLILVLAFLLLPSVANSAQVWVAVSGGSTTTNCATASGASDPGSYIRTIAAGVACLSSGDTLFIKNGTYDENLTAVPPSGPAGGWTTILGESQAGVIIKPNTGRVWQMSVSAGQTRTRIKFENLTLNGNLANQRLFTTFNGRFGFLWFKSINFINAGTVLTGDPAIAITCGGDGTGSDLGDWIIEDSLIHTARTGIYYQCPRGILRNNEWHTLIRNGILIQSNNLQQPGQNLVTGNLIYNTGDPSDVSGTAGIACNQPGIYASNIIRDNTGWGIRCTQFAGGTNHAKLFNNTVEGNGGGGIRINSGSQIEVRGNIVFGNSGTAISDAGTSTVLENNTTTDPSFVNAAAHNFNVPSGQASNGTDLTAQGIPHNLTAGRGALDPMERASMSTGDANTVRVVLHNSFGGLRNATTPTGWSCKFDGGSAVVPASTAAAGDTAIDLNFSGTPMGAATVVTCSYSSTTGSLLNSIGIGNRSDATGNAHLLSFTDQAVTNTLTGGGGGGEEEPPATATVGHSSESSDTTTPDAVMPTSAAAGDLLLAFKSFNGIPTVSTPISGFAQICRAANTNVAGEFWYKIAAGGETNTTYTISAAENSITRIFRIPVAVWHGTTPPECATATGTSATPDPPSLSPSWAGSENLRWFGAYSRFRGDVLLSAFPANYPDDNFTDDTGTASATVQMGVASRALNTATEDPGAFATGSGAQNWAAFTVAVRAVGGGAGGGGEPAAVWEQRDYCWKYWQDAETVACSFAQNTQAISHRYGRIVARIGLKISAGDPEASSHVGEYRINGGAWASISNSACAAPCIEYTAPRVRANGEATTRLLTLPGGLTFAAGALQAQAGASAIFDFAEDAWVEFDQSIQLVGLSVGDIVEIRMRKEVGALYDTYTNYPTLLVVGDRASAS